MYSLTLVEKDIRNRVDTDRDMSFGSFIVWYSILSVVALFLVVPPLIYLLIIYYRLVERRNQHFERQLSFFRDVTKCLNEHFSNKQGIEISGDIQRIQNTINDDEFRRGERNPWIWGVLLPIITVGLAWFYSLWFLMRDFREHSRRQSEINEALNDIFRKTGLRNVAIVDDSLLPKRSFWGYLLFTILTFGIFGIYWMYIMFKDPNDHFKKQAFAEDQIVGVLRALPVA